jgi:hypothetical protein
MRMRMLNLTLFFIMGLALVVCGLAVQTQADGGYSGVWTSERPITRKAKPNRVPANPSIRKRTEPARLLTVQWRLLKQDMSGNEVEVDPTKPLYTGDRIRFAVKVNQDGFLYMIQNSEGGEGEAIFPDARINGGKNFVKRDSETVIPSNCDDEHKEDCWYLLEPPEGREAITVIFSRDMITTLPNTVEEASALIKKHVVSSLQLTSPKPTYDPNPKSAGAGRFVTWATNMNVRDNEELVTTFYLTQVGKKSDN